VKRSDVGKGIGFTRAAEATSIFTALAAEVISAFVTGTVLLLAESTAAAKAGTLMCCFTACTLKPMPFLQLPAIEPLNPALPKAWDFAGI